MAMTPTEVITASGGKVVSTDEQRSRKGPNRGLLKGNYASGQFQFKVVFYFNENTNLLSLVQLTLLDPTLGYALEQSLVAKYGKPLESFAMSPGRIIRWQDQSNNNRIEVIHIEPRLVTLSYYPFSCRFAGDPCQHVATSRLILTQMESTGQEDFQFS